MAGTADDWWRAGEAIHRYLATAAAEWWVAELDGSREIIGYGRSVEREQLFELTELMVHPRYQSSGVGGKLIELAFPVGRGDVRVIIATGDVRALSHYYRAELVIQQAIVSLTGQPREAPTMPFVAERLEADADLTELNTIERSVVGYPRSDVEHRWLISEREGYVYRRRGTAIGFSFVGRAGIGPIAVLDPADLPGVLHHVENRAFALGRRHVQFEIPSVNVQAVNHLLGRGFRLNPWINYLMSNRPFGKLDRYVLFGPRLFL